MTSLPAGDITVAGYLKTRLEQLGLDRLFGVAGNYTTPFLDTSSLFVPLQFQCQPPCQSDVTPQSGTNRYSLGEQAAVDSVDVLGDAAPVVLAFDQPSSVAPSVTSGGLVGGRLDDDLGEFGLAVGCYPPAVRPSRVGVDERLGTSRIGGDYWESAGHGLQVDLAKRLIDRPSQPDRCASWTRPVPVMLSNMSATDESYFGLDLRSDIAELTCVSPYGGDIACCRLGGGALYCDRSRTAEKQP